MLKQKILPAILVVMPATAALTAQTTTVEATADACRTRPGSATQPGAHWYYRVNRIDNRRCWFLSSQQVAMRSHARAGSSHLHRSLPSAIVASKQLTQHDRKLEQATPTDFATRWPDLPKSQDLDARKVATISHADADQQIPLPLPVVEAKRPVQRQTFAGEEAAFGPILLGGALLTAVLLAGGVSNLSRLLRRTYPRYHWRPATDRPGQREHMLAGLAEPAGDRSAAAAPRREASVWRELTPTDPVDGVKAIPRESTRDLQPAGVARVSLRSFAPHAGTRRRHRFLKQARA